MFSLTSSSPCSSIKSIPNLASAYKTEISEIRIKQMFPYPFLWCDGDIVEFLELWKVVNDSLPVPVDDVQDDDVGLPHHVLPVITLSTGVLSQPEVSEPAEVPEPDQLWQGPDLVLLDEQLLEVLAVLEVSQGGQLVQATNIHPYISGTF